MKILILILGTQHSHMAQLLGILAGNEASILLLRLGQPFTAPATRISRAANKDNYPSLFLVKSSSRVVLGIKAER